MKSKIVMFVFDCRLYFDLHEADRWHKKKNIKNFSGERGIMTIEICLTNKNYGLSNQRSKAADHSQYVGNQSPSVCAVLRDD